MNIVNVKYWILEPNSSLISIVDLYTHIHEQAILQCLLLHRMYFFISLILELVM